MGILDMSDGEKDYLRRNYVESFSLRGYDVKFFQIATLFKEVNRDPVVRYKDPIVVSVNFEDRPRPLLKKMHWLEEDEELPYVVFFPYFDRNEDPLKIERYSIVEFKVNPLSAEYHRFIVNSVRGDNPEPLIWLAKVSPYREEVVIYDEKDSNAPQNPEAWPVGYQYLKRKTPPVPNHYTVIPGSDIET